MSIRRKILVYFTLTAISLTGAALFFIYLLFAKYREEEFQERQKEKIFSTLRLLGSVNAAEKGLIQAFDQLSIQQVLDEKILIFNSEKSLIYASLDDTPVPFSKDILDNLSAENTWMELHDGRYDVVGVYIETSDGDAFYGISKAYDTFGYSKLAFLKRVVIATFLGIAGIIVLVSLYLSAKITQPLSDITQNIGGIEFDRVYKPIPVQGAKDEISLLAAKFNELMKRMNDAFAFQKHAVQHISHELKTPLAIMVSNLERLEKTADTPTLRTALENLKLDARSLADTINALLEIAKMDSGATMQREPIRLDELIFDTAEALSQVYLHFQFSIIYPEDCPENALTIHANRHLLRLAINNLMINCIHHGDSPRAEVFIYCDPAQVRVDFENSGPVVSSEEQPFMFQHFFRGSNSQGKRGFGLGLVLAHKIVTLHSGTIYYTTVGAQLNRFSIELPLLQSS